MYIIGSVYDKADANQITSIAKNFIMELRIHHIVEKSKQEQKRLEILSGVKDE